MSGPTTAAELVELARTELSWLQQRAARGADVDPAGLAAAWPRFEHAGNLLASVLTRQPDRQPVNAELPGYGSRPAPPAPAAGAEPHLLRAAELLAGAADVLAGRDRSRLSAELGDRDQSYVGRRMLEAAHLVTTAVMPHPQLIESVFATALATARWRQALPVSLGEPAPPGTLVDAVVPVPSRPLAPSDSVSRLETATIAWQQAALAVTRGSAPGRIDQQHIAAGAGLLLGVTATVLRQDSGDQPYGPSADALDRVRRAGLAWNSAHAGWATLTTGGTSPDPELAAPAREMHAAVTDMARTRADWARPGQISAAGGPGPTLQAVRSALAAAQTVSDEQAALVARLTEQGAVYGSPKQMRLTASDRPIEQQLSTWTPLRTMETPELQAAYRVLPGLMTGARLAVEAVAYPAADRVRGEGPALASVLRVGTAAIELGPAAGGPVAPTLAGRRWAATVEAIDPRLLTDPHYPTLAAALDRVALAGEDVPETLVKAAASTLPETHPARALHFHLTEVSEAAMLPAVRLREPERAPARAMPHRRPEFEVTISRPMA